MERDTQPGCPSGVHDGTVAVLVVREGAGTVRQQLGLARLCRHSKLLMPVGSTVYRSEDYAARMSGERVLLCTTRCVRRDGVHETSCQLTGFAICQHQS